MYFKGDYDDERIMFISVISFFYFIEGEAFLYIFFDKYFIYYMVSYIILQFNFV